MERCPECGGLVAYDYLRGEVICRECGLVVSQIVDVGPEWRLLEPEDFNRVRTATLLMKNPRHGITKWRMDDLLRKIAECANIEDVVEDAMKLIETHKMLVATKPYATAAAALWVAARRRGIPIPLTTIVNCTPGVDKRFGHVVLIMSRYARHLKVEECTSAVVKRLGLPSDVASDVAKRALELLRNVKKVSPNPWVRAAVAVYLAASELGLTITQRDVAAAAGVSYYTVRDALYLLRRSA